MNAKLVPVVLEGAQVRLEPLSMGHFDALCAVGLETELWRWVPHQVRTPDEMQAYIQDALEEQRRGVSLPFATLLRDRGQIVGCTRFANMDMTDRRVEIGWTWVGRPWQRSVVNTEAKYLMLRHAFEVWKCLRVELKTDALNQQSRNAILRIGAQQEGVLRRHKLTHTGRVRDTVYFSILDDEWPAVRAKLEARLSAS